VQSPSSCRCRFRVLEGIVAERVGDILSGSEKNNDLEKAHRASA
jgi:hypothetical protein